MEFKSRICTTREQSERLLALGLKLETADMVYHHTNSRVPALEWELQTKPPTQRGKFWTKERIAKLAKHGETGEEVFDRLWGKDVPAWSLSRLLELLPTEIPDLQIGFKPHHPELIKVEQGYILSIRRHTADCRVGTHMEDDPIECCVLMIGWLIKHGYLDKQYLNDSKK